MGDASRSAGPAGLRRLAVVLGAWIAFALAAHALLHFGPFEAGPVPGRGVVTLAVQAGTVSVAAILLIVALHPLHSIRLRTVVAATIWVSLIVFGHSLTHLPLPEVKETLAALHEGLGMGALAMSAAMLALLLGLPFVPSVEMGLLMMMVFGRDGALAAWLATIGGLSLAFAAGRYMPADAVSRWLQRHRLAVPQEGDPAAGPALQALVEGSRLGRAGGRTVSFLLNHRYLLFAALINVPGNSVLGGGGGIALLCGFSRLYRWPWFVLTTALASLPIPLLVFLGLIRVDRWLAAVGG